MQHVNQLIYLSHVLATAAATKRLAKHDSVFAHVILAQCFSANCNLCHHAAIQAVLVAC